ncbi:S8 family serine peptidase [Puniceibacterium sediminis]|uniref:Subtilase family protein n=1 Tax=Puniceibacterium sediminis TaxID=1608407 RepID=A0A238VW75_9RHOB|nr:S8 family serine peptidase [Puniceibacterium sediminis]SNR38441.1 Subtilase family protein [Puniceibacterium sediminis]
MAKYILLRDRNAGLLPPSPVLRRGASRSGPVLRSSQAEVDDIPFAPEVETVELSAKDLRDAARDPEVCAIARAMPTRLIEPEPLDEARPDDALPGWGAAATGADSCPLSGAGVRVAVLDTGVDADHAAFIGVTLTRHDFAGSGNHDANGHGTHVAATIFGRSVDGVRIGISPGITDALIAKVLTDDGRGSTDMLFNALCWAGAHRARVIAMSLKLDFAGFADTLVQQHGFPVLLATSVALESYRMNLRMFAMLSDMLSAQTATEGGCLLLAAAGNDSRRTVSPEFEVSASAPAAARRVISVGAVAHGDTGLTVAPFSNIAPTLAAPGVGIISAASGGGLRALNGTSMACAHAAGIAALWAEFLATTGQYVTADGIKAKLRASATKARFAPEFGPTDYGLGLAQAPGARPS